VWIVLSGVGLGLAQAKDIRPEDRFRGGKVEWARLKHSGPYWDRHAESDDALLGFIRSNTSLNIDSKWQFAAANDLSAMTGYPFLFADTLGYLKKNEQDNLAEYLRRGGFVMIDACGNVEINPGPMQFLQQHLLILGRMFPDLRVEALAPNHEVFSIYFKMRAFPPQTRPGNSWLDGPVNPLRLIYSGDRVVGIMSISGLQCGWSLVGNKPQPPMKMLTNIYLYAITR
jgi:hypothetical protein